MSFDGPAYTDDRSGDRGSVIKDLASLKNGTGGEEGVRRFGIRQARFEIENRRRRYDAFPTRFFGEPAWTMLLELYVAAGEHQHLTVTSLCALSDQPQTTALRWIAILEKEGLIRRFDSEEDKRVKNVSISDQAALSLDRYFSLRKHHLL